MLIRILSIAGSDILNRGLFFVFNLLVARNVTQEEFGFYAISISIGIWAWAIVDAGLTGHGIRSLAQDGSISGIVSSVVSTRLINASLFTVLFLTVLAVLPVGDKEIGIYFAAIIFVFGMCIFPAWIARGLHSDLGYFISYSLVAFVGGVVLLGAISGYISFDIWLVIILRNLSWLIGSVIAFAYLAKRYEIYFRFKPDGKMLSESFPLGVAAVIYSFLPLIPFLLVRLNGWTNDLGGYGATWQIQQILIAGGLVLSVVLLPTYSRLIVSGGKKNTRLFLIKHFVFVGAIGGASSLLMILYGGGILVYILGEDYSGSEIYTLPLGISLIFIYLRLSVDSILIATHKYINMVASGIFVLVIALLLMPWVRMAESVGWVYLAMEFMLLSMNTVSIFQKIGDPKSGDA